MIQFLASILRFFLKGFQSKSIILCENALLKKENEILLRTRRKQRVHFNIYDKVFFVVLNKTAEIKNRLMLVKPETLLRWQRNLIKRFWTFKQTSAKRGRKPLAADIKNLILSMKNENLLWGNKRIKGELLKLGITFDTKTVRNILRAFRRNGKIQRSLTWKNFLKVQASSIYAMDFFTVDTILKKRF